MLFENPLLVPVALALRNMRSRMGRTVLTAAGIALGVAVVLAIQITNRSTIASINQVFDRAAGEANLLVTTNNLMTGQGEELPEELAARMGAFPEVLTASPSIRTNTLLASEADDWKLDLGVTGAASGAFLEMYGVDPEIDSEVRVYIFSEGRMPRPQSYEVAIPVEYAEKKGLALGNDLIFIVPDGTARLEIVGLLASEGAGLFNSGVVAFAPITVVQELFSRRGSIDEIGLKIDPAIASDPDTLDLLKQKLDDRAGRNARVIYPAARGLLVSRMLGSYQDGLKFFSLIAVFVGGFLIYNTFSMTVVERTREIGMMRAIGMSRKHVLRLVLVEAIVLGAIGSLIGLVLGILIARGLMVTMGAFLATGENVLSIPANGLWQSLVLGTIGTTAAALYPSIEAARISPLEALRVQGRTGQKVSFWVWTTGLGLLYLGYNMIYVLEFRDSVGFTMLTLSVLLIMLGATLTVPLAVIYLKKPTRWIARAVYGREGELGSANITRSIGRTTLTVASLIVSLAMIVGIGTMADSFEADFSSWINASLGGDLYINSPVRLRVSFGKQLEAIPGVEAVTPARFMAVQIDDRSLPPTTEEDDNTIFYIVREPESDRLVSTTEFVAGQGDPEENWMRFERGQAVFLSSVLAESLDLDKGDVIYLKTRRGVLPFEIAGVIVDFFAQGQTITGSYRDMKQFFGEDGADRFTVKVAEGYEVEAVAEEIKARFQDRKNISVQTTAAFKEQINGLLDQSLALFNVLSLIGVVIGTLGVVNTLTMNVMERTREIGGLRSLGMSRRQVIRMVLAEALGLGMMGAVYGLAFGYVLANIMIRAMNVGNGYDLSLVFSIQPFALGTILAIGISQLAALSPAKRGAELNIVEAIKHE